MKFVCPVTRLELEIDEAVAGRPFECPACGRTHEAPPAGTPACAAHADRQVPALGISDQAQVEPEEEAPDAAPPEGPAGESGVPVPAGEGETERPAALRRAQDGGTELVEGAAATAEGGSPSPDAGAEGPVAPEAPVPTWEDRPEIPTQTGERPVGPEAVGPDVLPAPTPAEGVPRRPSTLRRLLRAVAVLAVLGALGTAGYFFAGRLLVRRELSSNIDAARAGRGRRDFHAACEHALEAERILREKRGAFTEEEEARYAGEIRRHKRAFRTFAEAVAAKTDAGKDFAAALKLLDRLLAESAADDSLFGAIEGLRAEAIRAEAERIAKDGGRAEEVLGRLSSLKDLLPAGRKADEFLERIAEDYFAGEKERARRKTVETIKGIRELLAGGEPQEAFALAGEHEEDLDSRHGKIRGPALADYFSKVEALAAGLWPEPGDKERARLAHFFTLRAPLRDALDIVQTGAPDIDAAVEKLEAVKKYALAVKGPVDGANGLAAGRIDSYIAELRALESLYEDARKGAADEEHRDHHEGTLTFAAVRTAMASPRVRFRKRSIETGPAGFSAELRLDGTTVTLSAPKASYGKRMYLSINGYRYAIPWKYSIHRELFQAAALGGLMAAAGVAPDRFAEWKLVEGPGFPMAVGEEGGKSFYFLRDGVHKAMRAKDAGPGAIDEFEEAARALRDGVDADDGIPAELRQVLGPVILACCERPDPRDYLDTRFCRRIIAEGYLEKHVPEIAGRHGEALQRYRSAYAKLSHDRPVFSLDTGGATFTAFRSLEEDLRRKQFGDQTDPMAQIFGGDVGEDVYSWRIYDADAGSTRFASPLPHRGYHPVYLCSVYEGRHESPPAGRRPSRLTVDHVLEGTIASCGPEAKELEVDTEKWNRALGLDAGAGRSEAYGEAGWSLPPHIPLLDERGIAKAILTRQGLIDSPDFSEIENLDERRAAQDSHMDRCARVLVTPGELTLFFRYFTQYTLDSPIAAEPELVGSHLATGETHQTAYELLDRKIGGYFAGDCDDVSEFFHVLTRRQGKLSHIFSLPSHAACGYLEETHPAPEEGYALYFLQTGPPAVFRGETLDEVVEAGVLHFSEGDDEAHFTVASVPFLFRFADEQTRTPYWLSDRILVDREYAEIMIRVQSYWHYHYYATAIRTMEAMLENDKDVSNYTELSGLYSYVGLCGKAIEMSRGAMKAMKRRDEKIRFRELVDIARFHHRLEEDEKAAEVLSELIRKNEADFEAGRGREVFRLMPIRFMAANIYCLIERPAKAYELVRHDVRIAPRTFKKLIDPLRGALVTIYATIRRKQDDGEALEEIETHIVGYLPRVIEPDLSAKLFEKDDGFNTLLRKYSVLGSYAFAKVGRDTARARMLADGPYPTAHKDHMKRGLGITEEDWAWFRVCPHLYMGMAAEVTDHRKPEKLDPELAIGLIDAMLRGAEQGAKLGSMNTVEGALVRGRILRAILKKDLADFDAIFARVKSKEWSRHFTNACSAFGDLCGHVPLDEFGDWMDVFHKHIEGKQHYFKIAYMAAREGFHDHALVAAEKSARYFPEVEAMAGELVYMRELVRQLKAIKAERERRKREKEGPEKREEKEPEREEKEPKEEAPEEEENDKKEDEKEEDEKKDDDADGLRRPLIHVPPAPEPVGVVPGPPGFRENAIALVAR